jgi:hypothetical protein
MADVITALKELSTAPSEDAPFNKWLEFKEIVAFLKTNARQNEFVVYATIQHAFMHAIAVPMSLVNPPNVEDLMLWNCTATSSWGVCTTFSEPRSISISPPLDHTGSKTLDQGEQLVFSRRFEGRVGRKNYYEVLQKFVHLFDLHFLDERNAYCRIDKHGDIEEVIRIVMFPSQGGSYGGTVVTFNRKLLDEYLALTNSAIVRTFDFTRYRPSQFGGWSAPHLANYATDGDFSYRSHLEPGHASYLRGFQVVRPMITKAALIRRHDPTHDEDERQYASFIAQDWKNNVVREISCAPGATANYFTKSDLPFELSPAFFRSEVLSKYKTDSEKYRLDDRSINCREAWHLETYDINEAGQVHTYLIYLRYLPYEEQLHWKAYNEPPKGPISKRAFKTDFEGCWDFEYDALNSIKEKVRELRQKQVPWWTLRSENLIDRVHYPVTSSADEWSNEILLLDQLLVEGFETKWLRQKATSLGGNPDLKFGSLKLIEECLIRTGFAADDAQKLIAPLKAAHDLRSKLKGHASGSEAETIKRQALKDHGSYQQHFRILASACDEAVRAIAEQFAKFV